MCVVVQVHFYSNNFVLYACFVRCRMSSLAELEKTLATKSYLSGYSCSKTDTDAVNKFGIPDKKMFPNVYRWAIHIVALVGIDASGVAGASPAGGDATKADDDDLDLFGDDDEDDEAAKAEALKAQKKAKVLPSPSSP